MKLRNKGIDIRCEGIEIHDTGMNIGDDFSEIRDKSPKIPCVPPIIRGALLVLRDTCIESSY